MVPGNKKEQTECGNIHQSCNQCRQVPTSSKHPVGDESRKGCSYNSKDGIDRKYHDYTKGNVRFNNVTRTDFDLVTKYKVNNYLSLDVKADYTNTKGLNRQELGCYGTAYYLLTMPRNIQLNNLDANKFDAADLASGVYTHVVLDKYHLCAHL